MIGKSICFNCNIEFKWKRNTSYGQPAKYCSNQCRLIHKKAKITKTVNSICITCGKQFRRKTQKSQIDPIYCSMLCRKNYKSENDFFQLKVDQYNKYVIKNENGCWDWKGPIDPVQGYTRCCIKRKNISAHRLSWMIHHGEIPKGKQINHHCDNRRCSNPEHLYLGTVKENNDDKKIRDRNAKGSKNGSSKLNENQVIEIKNLLKNGCKHKEICKIYNISNGTVSNISTEKNWKHVII